MRVKSAVFGDDEEREVVCAEKLVSAIRSADQAFRACVTAIERRNGGDMNVALRLRTVRRFLGLWATQAELVEVYDMWHAVGSEQACADVQARVARVEAAFWRDNVPGHVDAAALPLGRQYVALPFLKRSVACCTRERLDFRFFSRCSCCDGAGMPCLVTTSEW